MTIQAIFWDLGGVILRTEDPTPRQELAAKLGISRKDLIYLVFESPQGRMAQLGKITPDELWETVRAELKIPPEEMARVQEAYWGGDVLDSDLVGYIRSLKGDYRTALLSNAWSDLRQVIHNHWHIDDAFDEMIISAELGLMKPDPGIYRLALEHLAVQPERSVFIDDMLENVEGARAVGMQAVHFRNREQALEDLSNILARGEADRNHGIY
ncbi:MAG: HAD family phosphatase [Chloroflexota bacterium]